MSEQYHEVSGGVTERSRKLAQITEELESVKQEMDERGSSMTDGSMSQRVVCVSSSSSSPLYRVFACMSPRQTMSIGDTLLQLLFRFIVNTVYGAYLPCSCVGSDGLRQHFPENVCSA